MKRRDFKNAERSVCVRVSGERLHPNLCGAEDSCGSSSCFGERG